jgi:hypothetical protein
MVIAPYVKKKRGLEQRYLQPQPQHRKTPTKPDAGKKRKKAATLSGCGTENSGGAVGCGSG